MVSPRQLPEKPVRTTVYLYQRHVDHARRHNINLSHLLREMLDRELGPNPTHDRVQRKKFELQTLLDTTPRPEELAEKHSQLYANLDATLVQLWYRNQDQDLDLLEHNLLFRSWRRNEIKADLVYWIQGYRNWKIEGPGHKPKDLLPPEVPQTNSEHVQPTFEINGPGF